MHRAPRAPGWCWLSLLLVMGLVMGLALPALAQRVVVTMKDGRELQGELVSQDDQQVVLEIANIRTTLDRADVRTVAVQPTIEQEYRERRAKLEDDNLDGRYNLAYDMFQRNAYELAMRELNELRERFPDEERVRLLTEVVQQRQQQAQQQEQATTTRPAQTQEARPARLPDRLTAEQINRIRVYEVDLNSADTRVQIPTRTVDAFMEEYAGRHEALSDREARNAFRRASATDQLRVIFALQARDYYDQVTVRNDRPAMREFRTRVHRQYVVSYCATNQCHGGMEPVGGFYLFQAQPGGDQTVYTNFYILSQYVDGEGRMIDRDRPERSLLLQYGLPRASADRPHPEVPGLRPFFSGVDDRQFQLMAQILGGFFTPAPNYGIDYTPPGQPAAPAAAPTPGAPDQPAPTN